MTGFVVALYEKQPDTILYEGGSDGVAKFAEHAWLSLGGKCLSYRPKQLDSRQYGIEIWKLGWKRPRIELVLEPTFKDFASAAKARSWMMLEEVKRVVSFYNGWSPGTAIEIDLALDFIKNPNLPLEALYHH